MSEKYLRISKLLVGKFNGVAFCFIQRWCGLNKLCAKTLQRIGNVFLKSRLQTDINLVQMHCKSNRSLKEKKLNQKSFKMNRQKKE